MDAPKKTLISSLSSTTLDDTWDSLISSAKAWKGKSSAIKHYAVLQKINVIYNDLSQVSHADILITTCCEILADTWTSLQDKYLLNTARILSHLSVKVLHKGSHSACMSCCRLLISLIRHLDLAEKDLLSIAGHCYKSIWNKHSMTGSDSGLEEASVYEDRIMALRLAVAICWDKQVAKLAQQVTVAVSACSGKAGSRELIREGLSQLRCDLDLSADKAKNHQVLWRHLSMFMQCLEVLHSEDLSTNIEVSPEVSLHAELGHVIRDICCSINRRDVGTCLSLEAVRQVLSAAKHPVELQSLSLLLNAASKFVTSDACQTASCKAVLSWADVLVADMLVHRKLFEVDEVARQSYYYTREVYSCVKLLYVSAHLVTHGEGGASKAYLEIGVERVKTLLCQDQETAAKPFKDIAHNVGKIVDWVTAFDINGTINGVAKELAVSTMTALVRLDCLEAVVTLRRQFCDLLVRQSAYQEALDSFIIFRDTPKSHWDGLVVDWCKVLRGACNAAAGSSVSSRVLGVEVFGKLANRDDIIALIFKEFTECRIKECFYEHLKAVLTEMKGRAVSQVHKALHCLCLTEMHITLDKYIELAQQSIEKGIGWLKECPSTHRNDLMAQFYTWQYVLSYRERCSMTNVNDALSLTGFEAPDGTVKSQQAAEQALDDAVALWSQSDTNSLYHESKTAQCLETICSTFYLSKNMNKLRTVCMLATKLLTVVPPSIQLLHCESLILLGAIEQARIIMDKMPEKEYDEKLILTAKLCLTSGDHLVAVELLEGIIKKQKKHSLENVYHLALARRLLLDIALQNPAVVTATSISSNVWHCQREHAVLFGSMVAYPLRTYGLKLMYLDAVLSSYVTLSKVNLYVGSVRECLCFLQVAANMAKLLLLPVREADIAITHAKLDCFLEELSGAEVHLRHAHMILTSQLTIGLSRPLIKDQTEALPQVAKSGAISELNAPKIESLKQADTFGFESDGDVENDSFTIKEPTQSEDDELDYKLPSYTESSRDDTASPSLNSKLGFGHNFADWEPYRHKASCKCASCGDIMLQLGHLHVLEGLSIYRLKSGLPEAAISLAKDSLARCAVVEGKIAALGYDRPAELVSCQLGFYKSMMKGWFAMRQYRAMEEGWAFIEKVRSTGYHTLAILHLTYLYYLPRVMPYYQASKLELKKKYLVSARENLNSPLQTIDTNTRSVAPRPSVINAPRTTRTVALNKVAQLAFDDSDTEESQAFLTKRSVRASKVEKPKTQKSESQRHPSSCLAKKPSKLRGSKKTPISIFCDDVVEQKRATKTRKNTCSGDATDKVRPVRSERNMRTARRETLRSLSVESEDGSVHRVNMGVSPVLEVFSPEQIIPGEERNSIPSATGSGDWSDEQGIELLRGDETTPKLRSRKYSAAESMRACAPSQYSSPPELLTSPTELVTAISFPDTEREALIDKLTAVWRKISGWPPYQLYKAVCQALATLHYKQADSWLSAFDLMETQAITFSHKSGLVEAQKNYQCTKQPQTKCPILEIPPARTLQDFKNAVNSLPNGVIACNISVVSTPESDLQQLYVSRLERNQEPVVVLATDMPFPQEIWKEFEQILKASKNSMKVTQKVVWWNKRRQIDDRLKELLSRMQETLGVPRAALLGCYEDKKSRQVVDKCTERVTRSLAAAGVTMTRSLVKMLVNGADVLSEKELSQFLLLHQPAISKALSLKLVDTIKEGANVTIDRREPVIICLDKGAHSLCWESMPYLSESPITRMPSIYAIQSSLRTFAASHNVYTKGVDCNSAFYVLNPENNLPSTQSAFDSVLSGKKTWNGIIGRKPTVEEYKNGLTQHDLFLFLGHGSGSKYLKPRELCKLTCTAAVQLMGCSSGAFDSRGEMEASGIIYDYHMANCPSVLACLWDVTDKDIDRFTRSILNKWLLADTSEDTRILDCIPTARRACKLQYLVGCASVVYGLPVSLQNYK